jgi:hypothetical protein
MSETSVGQLFEFFKESLVFWFFHTPLKIEIRINNFSRNNWKKISSSLTFFSIFYKKIKNFKSKNVVDFEFEVYMIRGIAIDGRHQPQKNQITAQHLYIPETSG